MRTSILAVLLLLFLNSSAQAQEENFKPAFEAGSVLVSEVSWAGTEANSLDEWIELFNNTPETISLSGWGIYEKGGSELIIGLGGEIKSGAYYIIERTDDNTISDILADIAGSFSGSGLNNSGENIVLKNSLGLAVDSLDFSSGWTYGDSATKSSMERKANMLWQTNDGQTINGHDAKSNAIKGTPKNKNSNGLVVGVETNNQTGSNQSKETEVLTGGADLLKTSSTIEVDAGPDMVVEVGSEVKFSSASKPDVNYYRWHFGDGAVKEGIDVAHTYMFPGVYWVTLEVSDRKNIYTDQARVEVFGGRAKINEFFMGSKEKKDGWLELYNPTEDILDLSSWKIEIGDQSFSLPLYMAIEKNGYLVLPESIMAIDFRLAEKIILKYPDGTILDEVLLGKMVSQKSAARFNDKFFWSDTVTPGKKNIYLNKNSAVKNEYQAKQVNLEPKADIKINKISYVSTGIGEETKNLADSYNNRSDLLSSASGFASGYGVWLAGITIFGILAAVLYIRFVSKK